jgi:acetylcholinesterase
LTLNVVAPANTTPGSKLPVVVWLFGGGFEFGSSASYDGSIIVNRSIELQKPVIYVSMNYRLAAFGFLASQEVKDKGIGNLGLWDREFSGRRYNHRRHLNLQSVRHFVGCKSIFVHLVGIRRK